MDWGLRCEAFALISGGGGFSPSKARKFSHGCQFKEDEMQKAILIVTLVLTIGAGRAARAAASTADCSLLTPAQIQQVLGQPFSAPDVSQAPPAYGKQPWGSHCSYRSQKGHASVEFIVYIEASASEAKQTFDRLAMWFPAKSKPSGIGDSAYIDSRNAIHVLKGKVRYFISLDPNNEKQLTDLALSVAAHI
jgi:hypothetical protein